MRQQCRVDIILIEIAMAHEAPLQGCRVTSELINSSQVHIYLGKEMTFANTIIIETRKLIAPNGVPTIHQHPHPQNALTICPFAIVNGKYVTEKNDVYRLLLTLVGLTDSAIHHHAEGMQLQINQMSFSLSALLHMCEELADVATALSEHDNNPFYLFLNPLLKYREYLKLHELKTKLHFTTQFFNKKGELDIDYFLLRLYELDQYVRQLQKKRKTIAEGKFIKICVIALLKHFSANNKKMLEVALQNPEFEQVHAKMIEHITECSEYYQKAVEEKREVVGGYASFHLERQPQKKPAHEPESLKQRIIQGSIKPAVVTLVFLTLLKIFSS